MIPAENGAFLIFLSDEADESTGSVIKVTKELQQTGKISTEIKQCSGGRLLYISANIYYAVCSYVGNSRGRMIVNGASGLDAMFPVKDLSDIGTPAEFMVNTGNTLVLSTTEIPLAENIMLTILDSSSNLIYKQTYGGKDADTAVAFYTVSDGVIIFGYTDSKDGDIGKNFGRSDVWVFKISDR